METWKNINSKYQVSNLGNIKNNKGEGSNWDGLRSAKQIISISYDPHLGCYIVFWQYDDYLV